MKYLMLLLFVFGLSGALHAQTVDPCRADIDTSGTVDFRDFLLLANAYGKSKCGVYWFSDALRLLVRDTLVVRDTLFVVLAEPPQPQPEPPPQPQPQPPQPQFRGDCSQGWRKEFLAFLASFDRRQGDPGFDNAFDLDSDGSVNFSDFILFVGGQLSRYDEFDACYARGRGACALALGRPIEQARSALCNQ